METDMAQEKPREGGAPGTTDQWPRWEGPPGSRPPGYLPAKDEPSGELPEEDEDNAYQNSDEALPDDEEEDAIARDPDREGGRFDEI